MPDMNGAPTLEECLKLIDIIGYEFRTNPQSVSHFDLATVDQTVAFAKYYSKVLEGGGNVCLP